MFHSAALKLTTWYLAIIMSLSIIFSLALYGVSSADLGHSANRQVSYYNGFLSPYDLNNYSLIRQKELDQDESHLRNRLIWLNVVVLVTGGMVSYALARRTLEPIEEALESQKRFAADASHELRTPLTAMQTEIEVALRNPKMTQTEAVAQLQSNLEEVGKLKSLSEGLLKLASSGNADLTQTVDLKNVVASASDRLLKTARVKKIKLVLKTSKVNVRGDAQNLSDLAAILIDNAIKNSSSGSTVNVSCGRQKKYAFIKVSDQGQGIAAVDLPKIFDRFYRADSSRTKTHTDGYGLGLALAKKIADSHNGHIEVQSTVGKGSSFSVYLPLA